MLDCSFQSHDQVQPISCGQKGLIQVLAHAGIFLIAMENETGEMCFYYLFNFMGYYYVETTRHGENLHLYLFMHYVWIVQDNFCLVLFLFFFLNLHLIYLSSN